MPEISNNLNRRGYTKGRKPSLDEVNAKRADEGKNPISQHDWNQMNRAGSRPKGHSGLRASVWVVKEGKGSKVSRLAKVPREEAEALASQGKAQFMKREVVKRLLKRKEES
jgi:hypothetical protein